MHQFMYRGGVLTDVQHIVPRLRTESGQLKAGFCDISPADTFRLRPREISIRQTQTINRIAGQTLARFRTVNQYRFHAEECQRSAGHQLRALVTVHQSGKLILRLALHTCRQNIHQRIGQLNLHRPSAQVLQGRPANPAVFPCRCPDIGKTQTQTMVLFAENNLVAHCRFGYLARNIIHRLLLLAKRQPYMRRLFAFHAKLRPWTCMLIALRDLVIRIIRKERLARTTATCRQTACRTQIHP